MIREAERYIIDEKSLTLAIENLTKISPMMRRVIEVYGNPPPWRREPGFSSLIYTILEQQVSLASARAVYERLLVISHGLTPTSFNRLDDTELRKIGFSRQKTEYCRLVANLIESGDLDLDELTDEDEDTIRKTLTAIKGIGPWTADVYLLHSLGRSDIWPVGDLALRIAVQETLELENRPSEDELEMIGEQFRPWRSVAARVFWHGYLTRRGIREVT